jgi:hypothetical protein
VAALKPENPFEKFIVFVLILVVLPLGRGLEAGSGIACPSPMDARRLTCVLSLLEQGANIKAPNPALS